MAKNQDEDLIEFKPETGFTIETLAPQIVDMMRQLDMGAVIVLPKNVTIEIDKECTAREIIKGYKDYMKKQLARKTASNKNEK